jgi:hypothetical protein
MVIERSNVAADGLRLWPQTSRERSSGKAGQVFED